MTRTRRLIEQAAREYGLTVLSVVYNPPAHTGMGDYVGGWDVRTDQGEANGGNVQELLAHMAERFGPLRTVTGASSPLSPAGGRL